MNQSLPDSDSRFSEVPAKQPGGDLSLSALIGRPAAPPLRIHHILIVTAVSAVLLSINQLLRRDDIMGLTQMFASSWGAMFTIATAISVTLVCFGISWRHAGYPFFDLPGHWLLVMQSLGIGLFLAFAITTAM